MKSYNVIITEESKRTVQVDANSIYEAVDIASFLYKQEQITLESGDHISTEIDILDTDIPDTPEFREFVLDKAMQTLSILDTTQLAKIAFGSSSSAFIAYEKLK